jgi:Fe2+ transport system protein B
VCEILRSDNTRARMQVSLCLLPFKNCALKMPIFIYLLATAIGQWQCYIKKEQYVNSNTRTYVVQNAE